MSEIDFNTDMSSDASQFIKDKGFDGMDSLVSSFRDTESGASKLANSMRIPETLDGDMLKQIHTKLGWSDNPDNYKFENATDIEIDSNLLSGFRDFAIKNNLSTSNFSEIVNFQVNAMSEMAIATEARQTEAHNKAIEENEKALKELYGTDFDSKITGAREVAEKLGMFETLEAKGLSSDIEIIKMLDGLNAKLSDETLLPNNPNSSKTKGDRIKEITNSDAFRSNMHQDHKEVMAEYRKLHGIG